ncbi:MAG: 2-amino-4-hydroxy-6-hydroxymethyldihydropteridine diphosphokinase [Rhodanobacteraceae bacterium]|jgi:2-amino-4-hydroxy-6-hydroxymethyldihydropteridine diphosphokinase|nr:2-amino-4-hydroxy-6-hydroxymethyldihydropteridine diphosphokinase [Rhodanobacteraceae bacterium]
MAATDAPPVRAFVGLGSNLDDPAAQVQRALATLAALPHTRLLRHSRRYRTAPWGLEAQPAFVNAVAEVETTLEARALLDALLAIERAHGRRRDGERWGPRTLDLDLLTWDDLRLHAPGLELPHPRIAERAFVLVPLAELAPDLDIAGAGSVRELLARIDARGCVPID